jgi:hypothetical protein
MRGTPTTPAGGFMPDSAAVAATDQVVLGLGAAWGFAPADQTSPALAAAAGALADTMMTHQPVTELRIHGVSGSDGPTMLEHPQALQVAGDTVTGFFRRWSPGGPGRVSVPWKLEAYSWGGLTEKPFASAVWLLLAPFMLYNVALFTLPPESSPQAMPDEQPQMLHRGPGHWAASALLRLLALASTLQFVSAATSVAVSTVAWQAAGRPGMLPGWLGWYSSWTAGWRVDLALAAVAAIVAALWWVSVTTASKYEARTSSTKPALATSWPLTQRNFWKGDVLVRRQRMLHVAAAMAAVALIGALPGARPAAARAAAVILAAVVLAAAICSIASPLADRHMVTMADGREHRSSGKTWWCWAVLAASGAALLTTAAVSGWADQRPGPQAGALPGLTSFLAVLLAVQAVLLLILGAVVVALARRADAAGRYGSVPPYLHGRATVLLAALGVVLGGLLSAVISFGVTRLLGTAVPSGFQFGTRPSSALTVPWPAYAFGAAPVGLLAGGLVAAVVLIARYRSASRRFAGRADGAASPVAAAYRDVTAGGGAGTPAGDTAPYDRHRGAIASAWALADLADSAVAVLAVATAGAVAAVLATEVAASLDAGPASHPAELGAWLHGAASLIAVLGVLVAGGLVTLLRLAYTNTAKRKTIGALWDVATFWPRAVHPLAPPCYAERAVPEVVDRIRLLTGQFSHAPDDVANLHTEAGQPDLARTKQLTVPFGPVLLTGYSQGSVIAPAVVAQLDAATRGKVALLTLACPARRLYGRAFPAYFGSYQLAELGQLLDASTPAAGRWKNLCRRTDYIGGWVVAEPPFRLSQAGLEASVDQRCWDPVVLVPDADPAPPPVHRHSQWWQDPRTNELGQHLVSLLEQPVGSGERPRDEGVSR